MTTRQWAAIARERLAPLLTAPPDPDFIEELAVHLSQTYDAAQRRGCTEEDSRAAAMALLRHSSPWVEAARERDRLAAAKGGFVEGLGIGRDIRHALRMLVRTPGFSLIAVLTFAVGLGANTAVFSVIDGVLLRGLPYPDADRITNVWIDNRHAKISEDINSYPNYLDWRDQNTSFAQLAAYSEVPLSLTGSGEPERLWGAQVTANFFDVMGLRPVAGRLFTADNETPGKDGVIVISHGLWQRRFGGAPDAIGKTLTLSARPYEIVGVMPPEMHWPEDAEFWTPLAPEQELRDARGAFWLPIIGRLKPGVSVAAGQAEMSGIASRLEQTYPGNRGYGANVVRLRDDLVGGIDRALRVLMGAVAFVLLIACANLANLMLGRTAARRRELAIRTALGAGRGRLIRQIVTEALVLAMIGGAVGVLLAAWTTQSLVALAGNTLPSSASIGLDRRVVLFALAAATLAALLSAMLPALQASRAVIGDTLREGGRQGGPAGSRRTRNMLVTAEVALALVLLTGAGLLLRTLWGMAGVEHGFNPTRVGMASVSLPSSSYGTAADARAFYDRFIAKVRALPGVESAALTTGVLMPLVTRSSTFTFENVPPPPSGQEVEYPFEYTSPGFFETIGARMARGRAFIDQDTDRAPLVAVVNETLARSVWPGQDPIGRRLSYGDGAPWVTVVGEVRDMRRGDVKRPVRPELYFCTLQRPQRTQTLVVRTAAEPAAIMPSVRRELQTIDPQLPLFRITTLEAELAGSLSQPRFQATLLAGFAGMALLLAAIGIYGVTSHAVSQRTQEVGIRMAMGAARRDVRLLILRQHATPALVGVAIGLAGALTLSRFLTSLLYGVGAIDPLTYALVALSLVAVAVAACWMPATRATRVDPLTALRTE